MLCLIKVPRETLKILNPQNLLSQRQEKTNPQHQQDCRKVWSKTTQPKITRENKKTDDNQKASHYSHFVET